MLSNDGNFSQVIKRLRFILAYMYVLQEKLTKFGSERRVQMAYFKILNRLLSTGVVNILNSAGDEFFKQGRGFVGGLLNLRVRQRVG